MTPNHWRESEPPTDVGDAIGRNQSTGASGMIRVLFLHGLHGSATGPKHSALRQAGFDLAPAPELPSDDMPGAITIAQRVHDEHRPDVIVGSSLGGAVGLQLKTTAAHVLVAPAISLRRAIRYGATTASLFPGQWLSIAQPFFGNRDLEPFLKHVFPFLEHPPSPWRVPTKAVVIQSRTDTYLSFTDTERLVRQSAADSSDADRSTIERIEQALMSEGYQPLVGRLVEAGSDHRLNTAAEGASPRLHPHAVMVKAVKILAAL